MRRNLTPQHVGDLIHALGVAFVTILATCYVLVAHTRDSNIWIIYGSAIAFFAGRAGASYVRHFVGEREGDTERT